MSISAQMVRVYLEVCEKQKGLSPRTVKAYRIDLRQFMEFRAAKKLDFGREAIKMYVSDMNSKYQPRTVKRKIASIRAFSVWLEEEGYLTQNPFTNIKLKSPESLVLPKIIPLHIIERMLAEVYSSVQVTDRPEALRDAAIMEMLFATGIRVSELCGLNGQDIDLKDGTIFILGKGRKERIIQLTNPEVIKTLQRYIEAWQPETRDAFFLNRNGRRLSDQSVRLILRRYKKRIGVSMRITPHMFRHTLATQLLEQDVDIRYIQELLGHSSLVTTQIYTHVAGAKQRDIMMRKHPRNQFTFASDNKPTHNELFS